AQPSIFPPLAPRRSQTTPRPDPATGFHPSHLNFRGPSWRWLRAADLRKWYADAANWYADIALSGDGGGWLGCPMLSDDVAARCLAEGWGLLGARLTRLDGGMGSRTWMVDHS